MAVQNVLNSIDITYFTSNTINNYELSNKNENATQLRHEKKLFVRGENLQITLI